MLVGAMEGIGSMRELLRISAMRVDIRRFLGYGLHERLPVHQTISHAQTRRFVDAKLFERLFENDLHGHRLLANKWYFDALIEALFVRPARAAGRLAAERVEREVVDEGLVGGTTVLVRAGSAAG